VKRATVDMRVAQLTVDPLTKLPLLVLTDGEQSLPIWIGKSEAAAIQTELDQIELSRPVAHDVLKQVLTELGATVTLVELDDLRAGTYYAKIHVCDGERTVKVDARPSDAIALALRCRAPIRVRRAVLERAQRADAATPEPTAAELAATEMLARLPDENFGKWKM
jgi:bifunctional DNase/RNase